MKNSYGVDVDYFRKKIKRVLRDLDNYRPDELSRELRQMAEVVEFSKPDYCCQECGGVAP